MPNQAEAKKDHQNFRTVLKNVFQPRLGVTDDEIESRISLFLLIFYYETFLKQSAMFDLHKYIPDAELNKAVQTLFEDSMFPTKVKIFRHAMAPIDPENKLKPLVDFFAQLQDLRNSIAHNRSSVIFKGNNLLTAEGFGGFVQEYFKLMESFKF